MKSNANLTKAIAQAVVNQASKKDKKPAKKAPAPMPTPLGGQAGLPVPPMGGTDPV